ncbi:MAG: serine hydrolase domain-containing protein [Bacteroidota bacterium]
MKINLRIAVIIFVLTPFLLSAQGLDERLDALLDSVYRVHEDALGILIHVESPDHELSWTRAIGFPDSSRTIPLDTNQAVLIASNTKTYVSAAILRLVEEGAFQLDDPISDLLHPETRELLKTDQYDLDKITVRQLLSHTSGIHDYVDDDYFGFVIENPQYSWTRSEQIERSVDIRQPLADPGAAFSYGDINYLLLTEIIETQTQKDFYIAMRSLLHYESLGLDHTWFKDLEPIPYELPPFAHQYANDYLWDSYEIDHSWDKYGGGGMASTVRDAALFYQYLFEGKVIEDEDLLQEMYTYVLPQEESKYCLGIFHLDFGYHLYYHGGWWGTGVNYSPDTNTSIAVFTLVRDKRNEVNPFLGKKIHDIIMEIEE